MNYSAYTVRLSTEPSYYGTECTQQDAERIVERIGRLIEAQFPGTNIHELRGGEWSVETTGPCEATVEMIDRWISDHWTAAL